MVKKIEPPVTFAKRIRQGARRPLSLFIFKIQIPYDMHL